MKKVYQKPEFQIIVQDQANSKFFVASGNFSGGDASTGGDSPKPANSATQLGDGGDSFTF